MIRAPEYYDIFPSINEGFQANMLMQFTQPRFTNYEKWVSKPPLKMIKSTLLLSDFSNTKNISIDFRQFPSKAENNINPMYQRRVQINQDIFRYSNVKSVSLGHLFKNDNLHRLMCSTLRKATNITDLEIGTYDCERLHLLAKMLKHTKIQRLKICIREHDLQSVSVKAALRKIRKYLRNLEVIQIDSDYIVPHEGLRPFNLSDILYILNGNQKFKEVSLKPFADFQSTYQTNFLSPELDEKYNQIKKLDVEYILPYHNKVDNEGEFYLPKELQTLSMTLQVRATEDQETELAFENLRQLIFKGCSKLETLKLNMKKNFLDDNLRDPIFPEVSLFPRLSYATQLRVLKINFTSMQKLDLQGLQNFPNLEYLSLRLDDYIESVALPTQPLQTRNLKRVSMKVAQLNSPNKSQIEQDLLEFLNNGCLYSRDQVKRLSLEGFTTHGFNLLEFNFSHIESIKLSVCLLTKDNLKALCSVAAILPIRSLTLKDLTFEDAPDKQIFINRILRTIAESELGLKLEVLSLEKIPIDDHIDIDRKLTMQRMYCLRELYFKDLPWTEKGIGKVIENRMPQLKKFFFFGGKYENPMQIILLLLDYRRYFPSLETLGWDVDSTLMTKILDARPDALKLVNKFLQKYLKMLQNKEDSKLKLPE